MVVRCPGWILGLLVVEIVKRSYVFFTLSRPASQSSQKYRAQYRANDIKIYGRYRVGKKYIGTMKQHLAGYFLNGDQ